jgi:hypothetical protein
VYRGFWWGKLKRRDHLEDRVVDGGIILKWVFRKWGWSTAWIDLAHDRDRWWALVNVRIKLRVTMRGIF